SGRARAGRRRSRGGRPPARAASSARRGGRPPGRGPAPAAPPSPTRTRPPRYPCRRVAHIDCGRCSPPGAYDPAMPSERVTVRERLAPEITASLFANYRSSADAILELVDNSVDSRLPEQPLRVDLVVRPAYVQIVTVGGQGMGPRELEAHYLRWGAS